MFIFTGRFQPFHNGHLSIIEYLQKNYPDEVICVAIIKDFPFLGSKSDFDKRVDLELSKKEEMLNAEATLHIISKILCNRKYQNVVTTLMPRASVESWKVIKFLFDCKRVWIFTDDCQQDDVWEKLKREFYSSQNEEILMIPIKKIINGTEIRELLKKREFKELKSYLPEEVIEFYKQNNS